MIQQQSDTDGVHASPKPARYWEAILSRKAAEALTLAHWDVEPTSDPDRVQVDLVLRRNLRLPRVARPILIDTTTRLDSAEQFQRFLSLGGEAYGAGSVFLYIEAEVGEHQGREQLAFDGLPVVTAVGNILSFFGRSGDASIFRLRMTHSGNSFRRVRDPENELGPSRESRDVAGSGPEERTSSSQPLAHDASTDHAASDGLPVVAGVLTAWKVLPDEPHREFGWIEGDDGGKFMAYWRAFASANYLNQVRDYASENVDRNYDWVELDFPVRFQVEPPQRDGQSPRAVSIEIL